MTPSEGVAVVQRSYFTWQRRSALKEKSILAVPMLRRIIRGVALEAPSVYQPTKLMAQAPCPCRAVPGKKNEGGAGSAGFLSIVATVIRDGDLQLLTSPGEGYQGDSFKTSDTIGIANVTVEAVDLLPKAEFESCCSCDAIKTLRLRETALTADFGDLAGGLTTCVANTTGNQIFVEVPTEQCAAQIEMKTSLARTTRSHPHEASAQNDSVRWRATVSAAAHDYERIRV